MLIDSDGCFTGNWKYQGALADQPYNDIVIYKVIRAKWVELRNDDIGQKANTTGVNKMGLINPGIVKSTPANMNYVRRRRR